MPSQLLNWPDGFERTPEGQRESTSKFDSAFRKTRSELKGEMDRMDVDEWRLDDVTGSHGDPGVVLRWADGGDEYAVACDAYKSKSANIRSVYLWINETRLRGNRPVKTGRDEFAAAKLPSGDEEDGAVAMPPEAAYNVLGLEPGADPDAVKERYRELVQRHHPDKGGDVAKFQRIKAAYEQIKEDE